MELLQLHYFYESARNENFAETAKKYMVPTSSVSASVKRLEKELGVQLFDRSANRISLNERGYMLAGVLGEIFEKLDRAVADIAEDVQPQKQISILIKARRGWIADLIIQYKSQAPQIHFRVSHDASVSEFRDFDVIIDEQSEKYTDRARFLLSMEKICVKASRDSRLANQKLTFRQLQKEAFVMSQKNSNMWNLLEETAKRNGFVPNIAIESNDRQCVLRYVEAGMGLTLGSGSGLKEEAEKNIIALNVTDFHEVQEVYVYYRQQDRRDTAVGAFLDFLAAVACH